MARHCEPQFVVEWRNVKPPKCCHTCDWYNKEGQCEFFKMEPPEEFANTKDQCEKWIQEIPF